MENEEPDEEEDEEEGEFCQGCFDALMEASNECILHFTVKSDVKWLFDKRGDRMLIGFTEEEGTHIWLRTHIYDLTKTDDIEMANGLLAYSMMNRVEFMTCDKSIQDHIWIDDLIKEQEK